jgi:hypothetical protein
MLTMIKFCLSFCLSFLLLSIPINNKPVFFYVARWSKPITDSVFKNSKVAFWESVKDSKKVFYNTLPNASNSKEDKVKVQSSSRARAHEKVQVLDSYTEEEKNMLNRILKSQ